MKVSRRRRSPRDVGALRVCSRIAAVATVLVTMSLLTVALSTPTKVTLPAFSVHSSFTGGCGSGWNLGQSRRSDVKNRRSARSMLMYDTSRDPPSSPEHNAWSVLANTERWISDTLKSVSSSSPPSSSSAGTPANPYSRKEVSYLCETHKESPLIVANIFKRLRDARVLGERHGDQELVRSRKQGGSYRPNTLRQTQVIVIPSNGDMSDSFLVFDKLINNINQARRNARHLVTDDTANKKSIEKDWGVAVTCAHLHPRFGQKTPEQELRELQEEEERGEVDVNLEAYKEQRLKARQSPYPTIVVEVRANPPPDFGDISPARGGIGVDRAAAAMDEDEEDDDEEEDDEADDSPVTSGDIAKLEALFGKSAHIKSDDDKPQSNEEDFYSAIGNHGDITELSSKSPLEMAQEWLDQNSPIPLPPMVAVTDTDASDVDKAYEYVFHNIAMMMTTAEAAGRDDDTVFFLVMHNFLSSAATSFEKFSTEVSNIADSLPELTRGNLSVGTFHPEHILPDHRSPMPILALQYNRNKKHNK